MAHIAEEFGLGAVCCLGLVLGLLQHDLALLEHRDIADDDDKAAIGGGAAANAEPAAVRQSQFAARNGQRLLDVALTRHVVPVHVAMRAQRALAESVLECGIVGMEGR